DEGNIDNLKLRKSIPDKQKYTEEDKKKINSPVENQQGAESKEGRSCVAKKVNEPAQKHFLAEKLKIFTSPSAQKHFSASENLLPNEGSSSLLFKEKHFSK
ncbi:hypothetical protein Godav_001647, partial [Gossypium davidsonii]|nr:hypothetical protein [Gossypium davidsonii]MBA0668776.1 hypothetical protein [Gossypium klotzschianum]